MPKLSKFTDRVLSTQINVQGETMNVSFRPNVMTPAMEVAMNETTGRENVDLIADMFCKFITQWDITDENEEVIELTPDVVKALLPSFVLRDIMVECREAADVMGK